MPGDPSEFGDDAFGVWVSIRARHQCRAIRFARVGQAGDDEFQSAPDINAGRSWVGLVDHIAHGLFQSAPDINAGRSRPGSPMRLIHAVSIRARHQCRAIRADGVVVICGGLCFNPRPTSMPGDPFEALGYIILCLVSIRARHQCRAIPSSWHDWYRHLSFQSAPDINAGRSKRADLHARLRQCFNPRPTSMPGDPKHESIHNVLGEFQSAPDINAGRSPRRASRLPARRCFNPRPTSMPGDPPVQREITRTTSVSIRARHQCRAIRCKNFHSCSIGLFQSAPDINAGRSIELLTTKEP